MAARSVNKVIMIGNLVRDPEVVQINQNSEVAKFTLAVNESYKKPDGTLVENTTYIDCEAWQGLAKVVANYVKKGSRIYIEGSIRADSWTDADSGKTRTKHKIRIAELMMLDGRRDGAESGGGYNEEGGNDYRQSSANQSSQKQSNNDDAPKVNAVDDELPF